MNTLAPHGSKLTHIQTNGENNQSSGNLKGPGILAKCLYKQRKQEDTMKKITSIILVAFLLIIWGCSKDTVPTDSALSDEDQIMSEILAIEGSADEDYFYADIDEESEENFDEPFGDSFQKPIVPLRFGRVRLHPVLKNIRIVFTSDTSAEAYFHKTIRGNFISLVADTSDSDTVKIYRTLRPMGHEFDRIVHFVKRDGRWMLEDFSMVLGNSLGVINTADAEIVNTTLEIKKLVIEVDDRIVEITDPLEYFQTRESIFNFPHGTTVKLKVHVSNRTLNPVGFPGVPDQTEIVRLHHARHRLRHLHKINMFDYAGRDDNGNNVYEGKWVVGEWPGVHHAAIDVIDNGTIFDDDVNKYPYNSTTWCSPYKVTGP
jgi:hypothetical protein